MSPRNIFHFFTFIVISLTLTNCGNDDELTYPVTYTYNNDIEFEDFLLFKLNETGQEEIEFTERLSIIEPIVREDVMLSAAEFTGFNQITLLSEDQMLFLNTAQPTDSFFIDYSQLSGNLLRADLSGNGTEPFELMLDNNNSELRYCIQSSVFFRQPPNNFINGSLNFDFCSFSQNVDEVINDIRTNDNLVTNDTVFYNRANVILERD